MSHTAVNAAVSNFLREHFSNFIAVHTDGSLSPLSAGYAFYISELHVSFRNNLSLRLLPSQRNVTPSLKP